MKFCDLNLLCTNYCFSSVHWKDSTCVRSCAIIFFFSVLSSIRFIRDFLTQSRKNKMSALSIPVIFPSWTKSLLFLYSARMRSQQERTFSFAENRYIAHLLDSICFFAFSVLRNIISNAVTNSVIDTWTSWWYDKSYKLWAVLRGKLQEISLYMNCSFGFAHTYNFLNLT